MYSWYQHIYLLLSEVADLLNKNFFYKNLYKI